MIRGWLGDRLKEPSTHAALSTLFALGSVLLPAWAPVLQSLAGVLGLTAVVLPEGKS